MSMPTRCTAWTTCARVVLHMRARIPVYMNQSTSRDVIAALRLLLSRSRRAATIRRSSSIGYVEAGEERTIEGKGGPLTLKPFLVEHGNIPALGYRIGDAAYSPDMSDIPRESLGALQDLDVWIIDALALHAASDPHQRRSGADRGST